MTLRKKILTVCIIITCAAVVLISLIYLLFLAPRIHPVIEGKIYRSAQLSEKALEKMIQEKGIRTIINLRGKSAESPWYADESRTAGDLKVTLYDIRFVSDELPRYRKLAAVMSLLETAPKPVLIHCKRGADRTGLVSGLALILETNPPLADVKKQFSVRYGVLPVYRSTGPAFFTLYEQWLAKTGRVHDRAVFLEWSKREYRDSFGNLEFWVDEINGTHWNNFRRKKFMIPESAHTVRFKGWAFDASTNTSPETLQIVFDNSRAFKVEFTHNRSDVARYFKLGEQYYQNFFAGWEATVNADMFAPGCHSVTLRYILPGDISFAVPTETTVCR